VTAVALAIAVVAFVMDCAPVAAQISDGFYYLQEDKPRRKKRPAAQKPLDPAATVTPPGTAGAATPGTAPPPAAPAAAPQAAPLLPPPSATEAGKAEGTAATPPAQMPSDAAKATAAPPAGAPPPESSESAGQRAPAAAPPAAASPAKAAAPKAPAHAAAGDRIDPKVAAIADTLTGPDEAKFEALLNPPPRAGEKPVGQPVETSPPTETGAVPGPPPIGPDIETSATAPPPATADAPAAQVNEQEGGRTERGVSFVPGIRGELDERLALEDRARELFDAGRLPEAETEAKRLLALLTKDAPPTTDPAIAAVNLLGEIHQADGRLDQADEHYRRALALELAQSGEISPEAPVSLDQDEAFSLARIASVASARGSSADAGRLFERALRISTRYEHPATVDLLSEYARHEWRAGQLDKAENLFRQSIALAKRLPDFVLPSSTVYALNSLARVKHAQGDLDASLAAFREAKNVPQASAMTTPGDRDAYAFDDFLAVAYERATRAQAEREALSAEAFEAAQRAKFGDAAAALAQMAARQAQRQGPLADLARQYQDLTRKRGKQERQLASLLRSQVPDKAVVSETRQTLSDANLAIGELEQLFATDFPHYAALANPSPASLVETQALLAPNEAMIVVALAGQNSFAWALTRSTAEWRALALSSEELGETVDSLRCGLDYSAWTGDGEKRCQKLLGVSHTYADLVAADSSRRKPLPFDLARASKLYNAILGPFESAIRSKQLIVVPDGALSSLPLSVLVTEKPSAAIPSSLASYRTAAWLGARQPITMLPSVSSLRALRRTSQPEPAPEAYLGIGDPTLTGTGACPKIAVPATCSLSGAGSEMTDLGTRFSRVASGTLSSLASLFRSGLANVDAVRTLCPLPDTAHELKCVAQSLNAPAGHILTGRAATESALKHTPLDRYRVVHFATHGLLAGQSKQLAGTGAEPALVLTPPAQASAEDDGLLTTSEISELKLNADWVIMSACNTAAGAGSEHSEALSGLARAFFYAGARTLLVSHWEVNSEAAVKLTTHALAEMQAHPAMSRAEALKSSMATLITSEAPYAAHPAYWAPFVIVGEGATH
jgi:CHAT domain-containing protein